MIHPRWFDHEFFAIVAAYHDRPRIRVWLRDNRGYTLDPYRP